MRNVILLFLIFIISSIVFAQQDTTKLELSKPKIENKVVELSNYVTKLEKNVKDAEQFIKNTREELSRVYPTIWTLQSILTDTTLQWKKQE
jgi:peptidoglycan hydrolase CwlO-like protein